MKLDTESPFLQVNAVAQRARQLIVGATARVRIDSRQPTAIALRELRAGSIDVLDPDEAKEMLAQEAEAAPEEDRAATEAARVAFDEMWADHQAGGADDETPKSKE